MSFLKTNIADIVVGDQIYNTLQDFNLAIGNTDYIGDPVWDESNVVFVPGRSGPLFMEAVDDWYMYREIRIELGGLWESEDWDNRISMFRNLFEKKNVKVYFRTEPEWYWRGKAHIIEFEHKRPLGSFIFAIPYADPYKYRDNVIEVESTAGGITVPCRNSRKKVYPKITTDANIVVTLDGTSVSLSPGSHQNTAIVFTKCMNNLEITGAANVKIEYSEGSL